MTNFPFTVVGSQHGVGRHAYYLDLADVIVAVKTLIVGEFFLLVGLMFVKISVLLFLLNISGTTRWLRWVLRANLVLIFSSTFAFCFVIWFQCTPVQGNWDPTVPGRKCIELKKFMDATYVLSAITVFTDFLCALMPLPIIWKLKLNTKTKIGIMSVIALGLLYVPLVPCSRVDHGRRHMIRTQLTIQQCRCIIHRAHSTCKRLQKLPRRPDIRTPIRRCLDAHRTPHCNHRCLATSLSRPVPANSQ
jgi:hypothetical protein